MDLSNVVVCSFYTADDYYRSHAERLAKNLSDIGVAHELQEIEKAPGEDWADICRKKIAFLNRVCEEHPEQKVFWIDVDCKLLALPDYIAGSTADLIGFQRGFSTPAAIGYASRTRFWEPCFFGINTTPAARKFISDAATLERDLDIKATDDYFFEESWRSNAPSMTFQIIPSGACVGKPNNGDVATFFDFGASGNVDEFKGKVVQHAYVAGVARRRSLRQRGLELAKRIERRLAARSGPLASRVRALADRVGITHILTKNSRNGGADPKRTKLVTDMVQAGQRGDTDRVAALAEQIDAQGLLSGNEVNSRKAAEAFAHYAVSGPGQSTPAIPLMWWPRPFPGNFGDWLSPLVLGSLSDHPVTFLAPTAPTHLPHLAMIGSIGRFIKSRSIVVGTGISSDDVDLHAKASYVSVRGPLTAQVVARSGGPTVESFGDPGALISRIVPIERSTGNGRIAFVRHHSHATLPVTLPSNVDELSVLAAHPDEITALATTLSQYDAVVTSAMHVMIACHSYGIPVALVTFSGFEDAVHGTGIKYRDYCLGADLQGVWEPTPIDLNLSLTNFDDLIHTEQITAAKLDEIEAAVRAGVADHLARIA